MRESLDMWRSTTSATTSGLWSGPGVMQVVCPGILKWSMISPMRVRVKVVAMNSMLDVWVGGMTSRG